MSTSGSDVTVNRSDHTGGGRALLVLAILAALGIGVAIGFLARQPSVTNLNNTIVQRDRDIASLQDKVAQQEKDRQAFDTRLASATQRADDLQKQIAAAGDQAAKLEAARTAAADLQTRLDAANRLIQQASQQGLGPIRPIAQSLADDRLLLIEMRKDLPKQRAEAQQYWQNVRNLAVKSSPDLRSQADKIMNALPAYFDWAERTYASSQEQALTYVLTGAAAYENSIDELWRAVLLRTINHIDTLSSLAIS